MSKRAKGAASENDNEEENNSKLDELFSQMRQLSQQVQTLQNDNVILQEEIRKRDAIISNNSSSSSTGNGGGNGNNSSSNNGRSAGNGITSASSATTSGGAAGFSLNNVGNGIGLADMVAASNIKIPVLNKLYHNAIRTFFTEYDEYIHKCPIHVAQKMVRCMSTVICNQIANYNGIEVINLEALSNEQFTVCLKRMLAPVDEKEATDRFKSVVMKSDDLLLTTVLNYHLDWEWNLSIMVISNSVKKHW